MPNFWLLLILSILPLLMLIQKLKIGSFFDFSKSDSPPHQQTTTIGQQINIPVMGQDLAETITESIKEALQHQKEQLSSSPKDNFSKYNRINYSIDLILTNSIPIIMAYYSFLTNVSRKKPLQIRDDNLDKSISLLANIVLSSPEKKSDYSSVLPVITMIQSKIKSVFASETDLLSLHFTNIQKLIELRASTASTTGELKFNEETLGILMKALESAIALLAFMTGNWTASREFMQFSVSKLKALSENKPINKPPNK
jgi:hypothetical protein